MCFIPLPLGLVVKYLSNRSVRKVKHNYKDPKLFFLSRIMHLEVYNFGGQELFCYHCQPAAVFVMQAAGCNRGCGLSQCGFGGGRNWNFKLYCEKKPLVPQVG